MCYQEEYLITFNSEYIINEVNMVNLTLLGEGIAVGNIGFVVECRK